MNNTDIKDKQFSFFDQKSHIRTAGEMHKYMFTQLTKIQFVSNSTSQQNVKQRCWRVTATHKWFSQCYSYMFLIFIFY